MMEVAKYSFLMPFIGTLSLYATLEAGAGLGDTLSARGYDLYKPITLSPLVKMHARNYFLVIVGVLLLVCACLS